VSLLSIENESKVSNYSVVNGSMHAPYFVRCILFGL